MLPYLFPDVPSISCPCIIDNAYLAHLILRTCLLGKELSSHSRRRSTRCCVTSLPGSLLTTPHLTLLFSSSPPLFWHRFPHGRGLAQGEAAPC